MDPKTLYKEGRLVAQLKGQRQSAFTELYNKHAAALYTLVLQIVRNEEIGKNVMHKVFMTISRSIDNYDPEKERLFTWMLHIARITALDETRSEQYLHQLERAKTSREDLPLLSQLEIDNSGLKKAINKLDDEQKKLFDLYYYKGLTVQQIAESLAMSSGMVQTGIKTALSELGTILCKIS